ncbi:MAG: CHAT domain-containing protein [Gammaproteobacteria bacterium]|nr:CHAT domain-containing protein [Gammaproteobacteria bacterium]
MVAATLNNLALTKSSLGELDYAESAWQLAQRLAESTGDRNRVAQIEQNLGKMYFHQGRLELALDYLNRALAVHQDLNNNYWIGETLTGIGNIYAAIDEHSKALDYYQQTLDLNHDHQQQFANTLTQAAWSNWQLGHIAIAKQQYQQAYDSFASSNQPGSAAVVASKYGMLQFQIGHQQQALSAQARSISILDDLDNPREAARARSRLGQLLLENGQLEQAQQVLQLALQGHRSVKDELFELDTLVALSKTQTGTAALNYAQAATQLAAQLGRHNTSTEIQIGLGVSSRDAYERHINLLVAAGEHEQAWLINEQIRARSLLRLVGESATERYGSGLTAKLDTAAIHNKLGASRVMLSYFLGAEQSHLWLIDADSVQHFTLPAADLINSSATTLAATLRDWRQSPSKINHIASILSTQILAPVADQIQDKDLVIVADGNLQSIPFGLLPVQQNQADLPVINNHSVIYTPTANVFAHLSIGHAPATKNILVLADPMGETTALSADTYRHSSLRPPQTDFDNLLALRSLSQTGINTNNLPGARLEAQAIKTIGAATPQYDVTLKLGEQANRDFITSGGMRNYNIIHFATHGVIDAYVPELSGLMIASRRGQGADYLYPHDIAGLNLRADLVVLSGCETGIGKSVANEGLMSLSRPFFVAGAKQVIASLWKVSDRATAALMEQFYLHLLQADQTPEQALQSAQQWMQQQAQWQHPNFWAGFVISGA